MADDSAGQVIDPQPVQARRQPAARDASDSIPTEGGQISKRAWLVRWFLTVYTLVFVVYELFGSTIATSVAAAATILSAAIFHKYKVELLSRIGVVAVPLTYALSEGVRPDLVFVDIVKHNTSGWSLVVFVFSLSVLIEHISHLGVFNTTANWLVIQANKTDGKVSSHWLVQKILRIEGRLLWTLAALFSFLTAATDEVTAIIGAIKLALPIATVNGRGSDEVEVLESVYRYQLSVAVRFGNLFSAATLLSNPVTILVALEKGYGFRDFAIMVWPALAAGWIVGYAWLMWREGDKIKEMHQASLDFNTETPDMGRVKIGFVLLGGFIATMLAHSFIEHTLHVSGKIVLPAVPTIWAAIAFVVCAVISWRSVGYISLGRDALHMKSLREGAEHGWSTVQILAALTIIVETLVVAGFIELMSDSVIALTVALALPTVLVLYMTFTIVGKVVTNSLDNVVAAFLLMTIIINMTAVGALSPIDDTRYTFLAMLVSTVTSTFVWVGSVGGIMYMTALKSAGFTDGLGFWDWTKQMGPFTLVTSVVVLVTYYVWAWHILSPSAIPLPPVPVG